MRAAPLAALLLGLTACTTPPTEAPAEPAEPAAEPAEASGAAAAAAPASEGSAEPATDRQDLAPPPPAMGSPALTPVDRTDAPPFDGDADARLGRWVGDAALTASANDDERSAAMAARLLENATLVLEFGENGAMRFENRFANNTVTREGTHAVRGVDGDTVTLDTTMRVDGADRSEAVTLRFVDAHALVMRAADQPAAFAFVRAADAAGPMSEPPFTPDALATFIEPGMRWVFEHSKDDTRWTARTDVVARTETGPTFEFAEFDHAGQPRSTLREATLTWDELAAHASWPAEATTRTDATETIAGEAREGWRFVVERADGTTVDAFFARDLPGPPLRWTLRRGEDVVEQNELQSFTRNANAAIRGTEGSGAL